ncbi:MAG: FAD binding domain-containing protein [Chloroflexota bacterium]
MLRLNRFRYLAPRSLDEALSLIGEHGDRAMLMAGGTDLLVNIKQRVATPEYLIGLRGLPELDRFEQDDAWFTLGANTSLNRLEHDPLLAERYPGLSEAASLISAPQIRRMGTLGGNVCLDVRCNYYNQSFEWRKGIGFCMKRDSEICRVAPGGDRCWAVASADTVPVLVALRAEAEIAGPEGSRRAPIEALYQDDGLAPMTLKLGEILSAIHLPPADGWTCDYRKFRIRQSFDFPLVGVATAVRRDGGGTVREARIVLTAVASYPERAEAAEKLLIGQPLDEDSIAGAGEAVFRQAKPMDNTAGSIFHRKRMARVLLERSLRELAGHESCAPSGEAQGV